MMRVVQLLRQQEFHIFLFILLFMLVNWPFLGIPAAHGLRSVFWYLFALAGFSVLLLFLIQSSLRDEASDKDGDDEGEH